MMGHIYNLLGEFQRRRHSDEGLADRASGG
jgi:hypothetical protein